MTQDALLYIEGATEGTTQWKAETLQMVNWGGFHGPTTVNFSPDGTLISGASGTGKSTLLDAYIALMMPSGTPFNGASNDATTGRARSVDQRNLLTYLRGKTDSNREAGTGELRDQVLRGADGTTWGAIAMTFIDDNKRRFTATRLYFVPRGATRDSDLVRKFATCDGPLNLAEWSEVAATKFDKRAVKNRFPQVTMHDTYGNFSQTLYTRLGIGANGDGSKALRLLARIQAGHQVRTVDDLYKSMVIEEPATFAAADNAVEHFIDLEASYNAMLTVAEKEKVLRRLPDLHAEREAAIEAADLIDTFGIHREGDNPFLLWKLTTQDALLETAEEANRVNRLANETIRRDAHTEEGRLDGLLREVQEAQREAGGSALKRLEEDMNRLGNDRDTAERARTIFDTRTARLDLHIDTADDFATAQANALSFLTGFDTALEALTDQQAELGKCAYPLQAERDDLRKEAESFKGRQGRVPRDLHESRVAIAEATGMQPADLPFVAELVDLQPDENRWRKAIEVTLHGLARVMLVDERQLDHLSRRIDSMRIKRINFQGITLRDHEDVDFDPARISGKLQYKDSPFSAWVQDRISDAGIDAICVETPAELAGRDRRVTINGQTRHGKSGAHGDYNSPNVIGFSSVERLQEIADTLTHIETELGDLGRRDAALRQQMTDLHGAKGAHETVRDTEWRSIDPESITAEIAALADQHSRILDANDILRALQTEEVRIAADLEAARRNKHAAEKTLKDLEAAVALVISKRDAASRIIDRINADETATLTDDQIAHLNDEYAAVADPEDLDRFDEGTKRLRARLGEQLKSANEKKQRAETALTTIFVTYQDRWADPNLGVLIDSYDGYRAILDNIVAEGLAERRAAWSRKLTDWSGEDLVPLAGAFEDSITDIENRLEPINQILAKLPFGDRRDHLERDHLQIDLRRLHRDDIAKFKRELNVLSSGATTDFNDDQIETYFKRLQRFMDLIRTRETTSKTSNRDRDYFLDVRKHVVITAIAVDAHGIERSTYAALGGKSGGETQELVAFIVGAALRFQLGDEASARPRFAPVFLDEGFVKSDSEFAGRAVSAWKGLGFQLIIGAPFDKVTALEPHMDTILGMSKNAKGYSYLAPLIPKPHSPAPANLTGAGVQP